MCTDSEWAFGYGVCLTGALASANESSSRLVSTFLARNSQWTAFPEMYYAAALSEREGESLFSLGAAHLCATRACSSITGAKSRVSWKTCVPEPFEKNLGALFSRLPLTRLAEKAVLVYSPNANLIPSLDTLHARQHHLLNVDSHSV